MLVYVLENAVSHCLPQWYDFMENEGRIYPELFSLYAATFQQNLMSAVHILL
jgi:hypothetical protein